jgi:RNA recognition motif-containing protein
MKNLYVGNLSHSTTEAELRAAFQAHGEVEKVSVVTDRETGRARGFGFVEMTNAGEAEKAIAAMNGFQLDGRALTVNEAKPKADKPRGGGGGFGGPKKFGGGGGGGGGKKFGGGGGSGGRGKGGGGGRDDYRDQARQPREPRW